MDLAPEAVAQVPLAARPYTYLATELEADDFLDRFRSEFAGRMMADMEPWGEDEDLREAAVGLLVRHLVAEARGGFVRRVVGAKWN